MFPEAGSEPENTKPNLKNFLECLTSQAGLTLSQIVLEGSTKTDISRVLNDIVEAYLLFQKA